MPLTRSDWMLLAIGFAAGSVAGANWHRFKKLVEPMLDAAGEGVSEAYADIAEQMERFQDVAAERHAKPKPHKPRGRRRKTTIEI